ncbi:hypothetical protein BDW68DRAFT_92115 [Aspergillus falconensis]
MIPTLLSFTVLHHTPSTSYYDRSLFIDTFYESYVLVIILGFRQRYVSGMEKFNFVSSLPSPGFLHTLEIASHGQWGRRHTFYTPSALCECSCDYLHWVLCLTRKRVSALDLSDCSSLDQTSRQPYVRTTLPTTMVRMVPMNRGWARSCTPRVAGPRSTKPCFCLPMTDNRIVSINRRLRSFPASLPWPSTNK